MKGFGYRPKLAFGLIVMVVLFFSGSSAHAQSEEIWRYAGQNIRNTRHAETETIITPENVSQLVEKWDGFFETDGDISATPAVDDNSVYVPDWAGNLYRIDASTGEEMWRRQISEYTGISSSFSRVTPAIAGNLLIFGTQKNTFQIDLGSPVPAQVIAVNKQTGDLVWIANVEVHVASIITQSAVVIGNTVFVGVSSLEEALSAGFVGPYPCCDFRGSLVALDKNTGQMLWKTYMAPDIEGYSGNAIWGSTPVVDPKRNSVYVTTGNNYTVPTEVLDCVENNMGNAAELRACVEAVDGSSENFFDAVVALDMDTGMVQWHSSVLPFDAWNGACFFGESDDCPGGPDYDFGQGPALFTTTVNGKTVELLGAGQKSGIYWALNPDNGEVVWSRQVGPGGVTGGLQWGSATDGERIYTAVSNSSFVPWPLLDGTTVNGGFWSALDAATGEILWQTVGTTGPVTGPLIPPPPPNAIANNMGPVTVANGVVFAGALDEAGTMYAFDAQDGDILWTFDSGGSVNSGAAVVNGTVYWGSGYSYFGFLGTPNNKLYAFTVPSLVAEAGDRQTDILNGDVSLSLPDDYHLDTNYPNPFNPSTTIGFALPEAGQIRLSVYDMLGREVQRLVDGLQEAGTHEVTFEAGNLPSGSYIYRLETPQGSIQKVMVLMK